MEIFVDAALEFRKWHSDLLELNSEVIEQNANNQTGLNRGWKWNNYWLEMGQTERYREHCSSV